MIHQLICDAIRNRRRIVFWYDGYHRVVESYRYGEGNNGNNLLWSYQVGGESSRQNSLPDWRMFDVEKMERVQMLDQQFNLQRDYQSRLQDPRFRRIYAEI